MKPASATFVYEHRVCLLLLLYSILPASWQDESQSRHVTLHEAPDESTDCSALAGACGVAARPSAILSTTQKLLSH